MQIFTSSVVCPEIVSSAIRDNVLPDSSQTAGVFVSNDICLLSDGSFVRYGDSELCVRAGAGITSLFVCCHIISQVILLVTKLEIVHEADCSQLRVVQDFGYEAAVHCIKRIFESKEKETFHWWMSPMFLVFLN